VDFGNYFIFFEAVGLGFFGFVVPAFAFIFFLGYDFNNAYVNSKKKGCRRNRG